MLPHLVPDDDTPDTPPALNDEPEEQPLSAHQRYLTDCRAVAAAMRDLPLSLELYHVHQELFDRHVEDCRRCRATYNGHPLCGKGEDLRDSVLRSLRSIGNQAHDTQLAILFRNMHLGVYDDGPFSEDVADKRQVLLTVLDGLLGALGSQPPDDHSAA